MCASSVHSHKEASLKGSVAESPVSPSFRQVFVQSLTRLKPWFSFNRLCNSTEFIARWMSPDCHVFVCLQGCYSAVVDYFELYIYVAGALAIVVLTIEVWQIFTSSHRHYFFVTPVMRAVILHICNSACRGEYQPDYELCFAQLFALCLTTAPPSDVTWCYKNMSFTPLFWVLKVQTL